jgi:hypothetical protein
MALSDQDLKFATDIAYQDLGVLDKHKLFGEEPSSVGEVLKMNRDSTPSYPQKHFDGLTAGMDTLKEADVTLDAKKINQLSDEALGWKVVKTFDRNNEGQSGFYGVVIDTGEGLIVSFRGSESPSQLQNIQQDWLKADLGLIQGRLTDQQKDVNKFLNELKKEGYFEKYDDITFAGHSLGGNLAEHATFYAAQLGVLDRLGRTISYDGPGFSQEYLDEHRKYIDMVNSSDVKMDHIIQSLVGGLLQPVDGIRYTYAELIGEGYVQHGTENVKFDEYGNIVTSNKPTEMSTIISKYITSPFSQGMDRLISPAAGTVLVTALVSIADGAWNLKETLVKDGKLTTVGERVVGSILIGLATAVTVLGPVGTVLATLAVAKMVITVAAVAVIFVAGVILYDFVMDKIEAFVEYMITDLIPKVIDAVVGTLTDLKKWAQQELDDFRNMLIDTYKTVFGGLKNLFGSGPRAIATPHIKIDTSKLHFYADRLESVRSRLSSIDSDLNILYFTEGLADIINLAIAENLPTKRQMNKCIAYLRDTANAFEAAEYRIISRF